MANDKIFVLTPFGVADYPYLSKPDTKYVATGEYKVNLKLDKSSDAASIFDKLTKLSESTFKAATARAAKSGKRPPKPAEMPMFETAEGYVLKAKLKATGVNKTTGENFTQAPRIFDASNNPFPRDTLVTGGSRIRLNVEVVSYDSPKLGAGITLRLKDVQVKSLGAGTYGDSPFGAEAVDDSQEESGGIVFADGDDADF